VAEKILRILESPSKVKQYDRCEMLMQMQYKERWEPKIASRSLPARLGGTAFAKATELIHLQLMTAPGAIVSDLEPIEKAIDLFERQWAYCQSKGIEMPVDRDAIIKTELRRVIARYAKETPLRGWKITHVEYAIKEYGIRMDVAGVDIEGNYAIGEVKYKATLDERYRNSTIEEYGQDHQFHQYYQVWRTLFPQQVPLYIYLILVSGTPQRIHMPRFSYDERFLARWMMDTQSKSDRIKLIESGEMEPEISSVHRDQFGWCPMKRACLELGFDRELMTHDYVVLDELPE
jgi:hypothetical protein